MSRLFVILTLCFTASAAHAAPLPWLQMTNGVFWQDGGIVLGTLLVLYVTLRKSRHSTFEDVVVPSVPQTPMFEETLLTTMFHTARLNGDMTQNATQALLRSYKTLTGTTVTQNMIVAHYANTATTAELLELMGNFSRIERDTMMRGCVDVAVANGSISPRENDFLLELKVALNLDGAVLHNQIKAALRPDITIPPRQELVAA